MICALGRHIPKDHDYSPLHNFGFGLLSDPKACNEGVQKKINGALRCTDPSSIYKSQFY